MLWYILICVSSSKASQGDSAFARFRAAEDPIVIAAQDRRPSRKVPVDGIFCASRLKRRSTIGVWLRRPPRTCHSSKHSLQNASWHWTQWKTAILPSHSIHVPSSVHVRLWSCRLPFECKRSKHTWQNISWQTSQYKTATFFLPSAHSMQRMTSPVCSSSTFFARSNWPTRSRYLCMSERKSSISPIGFFCLDNPRVMPERSFQDVREVRLRFNIDLED